MTTSPAPIQPVETPPELTAAQQALSDFERALVFSGTRAEFHRAARLVLPFVRHIPYDCLLGACDCADLEVWYVRQANISWFYGVCHAHRLQPIGRAVRAAPEPDADRAHRRRRNGGITNRWYASRGL